MPTGLFITSDIQAVGAMAVLTEHGLKCPDDLSIVGFDDIALARHLNLTTMRQPLYEMGHLAAETLLACLSDAHREPVRTMFVPELVVRRTTAKIRPRPNAARNPAA
jgi:DNA-binding LacI/PurR family transcriptional regulator